MGANDLIDRRSLLQQWVAGGAAFMGRSALAMLASDTYRSPLEPLLDKKGRFQALLKKKGLEVIDHNIAQPKDGKDPKNIVLFATEPEREVLENIADVADILIDKHGFPLVGLPRVCNDKDYFGPETNIDAITQLGFDDLMGGAHIMNPMFTLDYPFPQPSPGYIVTPGLPQELRKFSSHEKAKALGIENKELLFAYLGIEGVQRAMYFYALHSIWKHDRDNIAKFDQFTRIVRDDLYPKFHYPPGENLGEMTISIVRPIMAEMRKEKYRNMVPDERVKVFKRMLRDSIKRSDLHRDYVQIMFGLGSVAASRNIQGYMDAYDSDKCVVFSQLSRLEDFIDYNVRAGRGHLNPKRPDDPFPTIQSRLDNCSYLVIARTLKKEK